MARRTREKKREDERRRTQEIILPPSHVLNKEVTKAENDIPRFNTRRSLRQGPNNRWKMDSSNMPPVTIEGFLERKQQSNSGGKRSTIRSWKSYYTVISGQLLCFFKDQGDFKDWKAAAAPLFLHNANCEKALDYTKKKHVFRLYTADRAEYLFQTSDEKELLTWIDAINYVLASFSAPQLPAACSSSSKFQRPLMPSSKSTLEMSDQLASHEVQLQQLRRQYEEELRTSSTSSSRQQNNPQPMSKSKSSWSEYKEKEEFLLFEIMRYETYILTLRTKNAHDT